MYRELHDTLLQDYDIFTTEQFYKLGLDEVSNMLYASRVRRVDKVYDISLAAWRTQEAKATKSTGKGKNQKIEAYYKTFKDFYDYEARLSDARGITTKDETVVNALDDSARDTLMRFKASQVNKG